MKGQAAHLEEVQKSVHPFPRRTPSDVWVFLPLQQRQHERRQQQEENAHTHHQPSPAESFGSMEANANGHTTRNGKSVQERVD